LCHFKSRGQLWVELNKKYFNNTLDELVGVCHSDPKETLGELVEVFNSDSIKVACEWRELFGELAVVILSDAKVACAGRGRGDGKY